MSRTHVYFVERRFDDEECLAFTLWYIDANSADDLQDTCLHQRARLLSAMRVWHAVLRLSAVATPRPSRETPKDPIQNCAQVLAGNGQTASKPTCLALFVALFLLRPHTRHAALPGPCAVARLPPNSCRFDATGRSKKNLGAPQWYFHVRGGCDLSTTYHTTGPVLSDAAREHKTFLQGKERAAHTRTALVRDRSIVLP